VERLEPSEDLQVVIGRLGEANACSENGKKRKNA
jgi:hypothetical protein